MSTEKNKKLKWILPAVLTVLLVCLTVACAGLTGRAWSDWVVNRRNVQERLYEAVDMLFASVMLLILSATLLCAAAAGLVRALRPAKTPGRITRFFRQKGLYPALGFMALFIVFFLLGRAALGRIDAAVETSEVPAALHDHLLYGWMAIGAELAAIGAILSVIPWIREKLAVRSGNGGR